MSTTDDGFEEHVSLVKDADGKYVGIFVRVKHLETGQQETFQSDHLPTLADAIEDWKRACE